MRSFDVAPIKSKEDLDAALYTLNRNVTYQIGELTYTYNLLIALAEAKKAEPDWNTYARAASRVYDMIETLQGLSK